MDEKKYQSFYIEHEHFTVEDYGENQFALYCEESFVELIDNPNDNLESLKKALAYERKRLS